MASIVGISINPDETKKAWETRVDSIGDWGIVAEYSHRKYAELHAEIYAEAFNSMLLIDENAVEGPYFIYYFDYLRLQ